MDEALLIGPYGIDFQLAGRLLRRPAPVGNLYWTGKSSYIAPSLGFLFIPCAIQSAVRCGASLRDGFAVEELLHRAESVLHLAAMEERGDISAKELLGGSSKLLPPSAESHGAYIRARVTSASSESLQVDFPDLHHPACYTTGCLRRADYFLYAIPAFPTSRDAKAFFQSWTALLNVFLVLDDIRDYREDTLHAHPNFLCESADIDDVFTLLERSTDIIGTTNQALATTLGVFISSNIPAWRKTLQPSYLRGRPRLNLTT